MQAVNNNGGPTANPAPIRAARAMRSRRLIPRISFLSIIAGVLFVCHRCRSGGDGRGPLWVCTQKTGDAATAAVAGYPRTASPPQQAVRDRSLAVWTARTRYGSSWPPGGPGSPPSRPGWPPTAGGVSRDCAAKKWPCWPGSAPTTTPNSSAATSAESPIACWTPSPAHCNSTKPNTRICMTWPAPPTPHPEPADAPLQSNRFVRSCSASSTE